ncbi:hypothetical protein L345_15486 [Ophiophagus hannah]|uniref:Major facilitator superfamily (MFS) profile domain-containing protein n=1 Tax=Ophiophagus hannah TaxID=8665 RepID=V8N944_OPHHA|nr:hypothetical protein L345_15486 [Ophiophagus hannah]
MGWGPITWLLMAEVLPLKARGVVSGLCVLVSWVTAFALTKVFLLVKERYGLDVPFFFFSVICVINLFFTYLIPETKGKSLERIESYFRTGRRSFLESFRRQSRNVVIRATASGARPSGSGSPRCRDLPMGAAQPGFDPPSQLQRGGKI